jgi:hypothetical protein
MIYAALFAFLGFVLLRRRKKGEPRYPGVGIGEIARCCGRWCLTVLILFGLMAPFILLLRLGVSEQTVLIYGDLRSSLRTSWLPFGTDNRERAARD